MPRYDQTGPMGKGPQTGRGFGPCGLGLSWRPKFGADRGMGRYFSCWNQPQSKEDRAQALADYRKALEEELVDIKKEQKELN